MFTEKDLQQIAAHGLTLEAVEKQVENFRQGFPSLPVVRAASVNDGVFRLNDEERAEAVKHYDDKGSNLRVVKFVPASGAASRMFKDLFGFLDAEYTIPTTDFEKKFFESIEKGATPPIDIYDTVSWMAITPLSEQSIALGGAPVEVPDFTGGKWILPREKCDLEFSLD